MTLLDEDSIAVNYERPVLKAKQFTAHALCHVTCELGVRNNSIFGISTPC